ncbi:MAG: Usg family protein [Proteobacteria bacterium]|nr:Usg family protein [Pseudomonadota bacterium]
MTELEFQLADFRLTTAEILYHMPDHPELLQTFVWQDYDLAPRYPVLNRFLGFWVEKIEGKLHSVYVAHRKLISPNEIRTADSEFLIH